MSSSILRTAPLTQPWAAVDPFIFCAYHDDAYPAGDEALGIAPARREAEGENRDWRMYHGEHVPGFPAHPHRGFETVTIVRKGLVDHADSLGGSARYGEGDVQWLTTGKGVEHGEMFPLINRDGPNPLDLFQIWLNLPPEGKSAEPEFAIFWADQVPVIRKDGATVTVVAGAFDGVTPPAPPSASWASSPDHEVGIWMIELDPGADVALPLASAQANRRAYLYQGDATFDGQAVSKGHMVDLRPDVAIRIAQSGTGPTRLLILQGRPIGAPVVAHGPFVLNSREQLIETVTAYQDKGFGPWPWPSRGHTYGDQDRFVQYPDGRREQRPGL